MFIFKPYIHKKKKKKKLFELGLFTKQTSEKEWAWFVSK